MAIDEIAVKDLFVEDKLHFVLLLHTLKPVRGEMLRKLSLPDRDSLISF